MKDDEIEIIPIEMTDPMDAPEPPSDAPPANPPVEPPTAPGDRRSPPWRLIFGAMAAAVIVAGAISVLRPESGSSDAESAEVDGATTTTTAPPPAIAAEVYAAVLPSVVYIQTEHSDASGETVHGVGAGVIVNVDGHILTANHVVDGATSIRVLFADGTEANGDTAFTAPADDIAVLATDRVPVAIQPAVLAGTGRLRVGDEAFAVGNPLGLTLSLSAGVISGLDRSVPIGEDSSLEGLIQFDTAVNPGNSGGPLLDREGQVVGIVTALANPSDEQDFSGIGFAVPIDTAGGAAQVPGQ